MVIIRNKEVKQLGPKDISKKVEELRMELAKENAQIAVGAAPKNPGRMSEIRKTIARLLTEARTRGV